mmetsp:Transcript_104107/g.164423  ORF Transcript_104107/g.164423 Transcript_104107/m.164423 type:complete len:465 (+) Transcript_104107:101-1495(+)
MGKSNKISTLGYDTQELRGASSERLREQEPRASVPSPRVAVHTRTDSPAQSSTEEHQSAVDKSNESDWNGASRGVIGTSSGSELKTEEWQQNRWSSSSWGARWWRATENGDANASREHATSERSYPSKVVATSEKYVVDASEIERAKEEGVLEAQLYKDGYWYVDLGNNTYKRVECDFWCPLCDAILYHTNLTAHLQSEKHRRRIAQHAIPSTCLPCSPSTIGQQLEVWQQEVDGYIRCIPCRKQCDGYHEQSADHARRLAVFLEARTMPKVKTSGLQRWQADDGDGSGIRCIPCRKICDGYHEQTPDHKRKLKDWLAAQRKEYDAPEDDWLAYVECDGARQLRCLMCEKWVVDFDGSDPSLYIDGEHSRLSDKNQKDHKKRMLQLEEYMNDRGYWSAILAEKAKWHPLFRARRSLPPLQVEEPSLPEGWNAAWSEHYQCLYYYQAGQPAQWTRPSLEVGDDHE